MLTHPGPRAAAASIVLACVAAVIGPTPLLGAPPAQDAAVRFTGAVIGSPAGSFATHDIAAPAGARVTVVLRQTNAPCLVGRKDGEDRGDLFVEADLQPGRAGPSTEQAACRQALSFVATGRPAQLRVANYARGFVAEYDLSVSGAGVSGGAQCQPAWDLAADFKPWPGQVNPGPDRAGRSGVWAYLESASLARDPGTFSLLPGAAFETSLCGQSGLQAWISGRPDLGAPAIVFNRAPVNRTCFATTPPIVYPSGRAVAHPGDGRLMVVRWRSPVRDGIRIGLTVRDADAGGGDGVLWHLVQGATRLGSGGLQNGSGPLSFTTTSAVVPGEDVYLMLDPKDDFYHDSTQVDWTIRGNATTCPAPTACPGLKAPADVVRAALAEPSAVGGWGQLCNPNTPFHPVNNPYRATLGLRNPNAPYDRLGNPVEYRCGCR